MLNGIAINKATDAKAIKGARIFFHNLLHQPYPVGSTKLTGLFRQ
jgi:hypothetical protein